MKQNDFVLSRKAQWDLFSQVLVDKDLEKQHDLPKMFRQLSHDLAVAKSRQYSPSIIAQLNDLLLQGQQHLYKPSNRMLVSLWLFWRETFPAHLRELRMYVVWAHILFYGVSLIAFALVVAEPEFVRNVMPNSQVVDLERMYDPASEHFAKERESDGDFYMFGFYIMNNITIAFQCFVGGLFLGFGALFFLLFNAIFFGAVSAHIVNIGYSATFFSFVVTHGAFELTAIVLSAAAGGVVGMHLLRPGQLSRTAALKKSAKLAFPIIFGSFLMLIVAAFIEAFWSSSQNIPATVKYLVGGICWLWILMYIFPRGKNEPR